MEHAHIETPSERSKSLPPSNLSRVLRRSEQSKCRGGGRSNQPMDTGDTATHRLGRDRTGRDRLLPAPHLSHGILRCAGVCNRRSADRVSHWRRPDLRGCDGIGPSGQVTSSTSRPHCRGDSPITTSTPNRQAIAASAEERSRLRRAATTNPVITTVPSAEPSGMASDSRRLTS